MMTAFSILSIKKYTDFCGDIVVLTDGEGLPECAKMMGDFKEINIFDGNPGLAEVTKNKFGIYCMKAIAHKVIDFNNYDFILYLDSDILVNYKNFQALLGFWTVCGNIQCADNEGWTVSKNVKSTGSDILTNEEKIKWANQGFCAGIIGFSGGEFGSTFCEKWWRINSEHRFALDDQGNLTALLLREYYGKYEYIRFMNKNRTRLDGITHYHSGNKPAFWNHVRYMLMDYRINSDIDGEWIMSKESEGLTNTWRIADNYVVVDDPMLIGSVQKTVFGVFVWWTSINGFEVLPVVAEKLMIGDSFRGGKGAFTLKKVNTY